MQCREKYILQKILIFDYIFYVPNQNSEKKSKKKLRITLVHSRRIVHYLGTF